MSNDSNLKWWPNGFIKDPGIDGELGTNDDKVKFYPLGTKKVEIPDGVNTTWPDGDALIGNFVYKNGKLVNFVDTAALIINGSGATTMPYDVIDTEFRSIFDGTLSITGPSQMNIRYQTDIVKFISNILSGHEATQNGGYKVSLDESSSQKVIIKLSLDTISALDAISEYVMPFLPTGYELEFDNLPYELIPTEYVELFKSFVHDSVITTNALDIELDAQYKFRGGEGRGADLLYSSSQYKGSAKLRYIIPSYIPTGATTGIALCMVNDSSNLEFFPENTSPLNVVISKYQSIYPEYKDRKQIHIHDCGYDMDGTFYEFDPTTVLTGINWGKMNFGPRDVSSTGNRWRIWSCTIRQNGVTTADFVPCIRVSDDTPGLWCNVYKKFYEQPPVATLDLNWDDDINTGLIYLTEEEIAALTI